MKILEFYILDAITGDVQKVYSEATNKEQEMDCKCEHWQQCAVCKPIPHKHAEPHKHAAMIKEWADDPSRVVEYRYDNDTWLRVRPPEWDPDSEYRFVDQAPIKPEIVSSLSDDELRNFGRLVKSGENQWRRIADFAAKKAHAEGYQAAIDAVCAMSRETSLSNFDLQGCYYFGADIKEIRKSCANKSIVQFQADVKKLLGGM